MNFAFVAYFQALVAHTYTCNTCLGTSLCKKENLILFYVFLFVLLCCCFC